MEQTRREFVKSCAGACAVGALTWIGVSCKKDEGDDDDPSIFCPYSEDQFGNAVIDLSECQDLVLDNVAVAVEGTRLGHRFVLTHTTGDSYRAFDARCTHEGTIIYATAPNLRCPLHGSQFSLNGTVLNGPAGRALTEYTVTKIGNLLTIELP